MKRDRIITIPLDFEFDIESDEDGYTQSEMQTLDNCGEKWYLKYNLKLEKKGAYSFATAYGGWIHSSLEEWYSSNCRHYTWNPTTRAKRGMLSAEQLREQEYYEALGEVQLKVYTSYYKHDRKIFRFEDDGVERIVDFEYETPFGDFRLKGMVDLFLFHLGRKGYFTMDHKTSSRLDRSVIMGWSFRLQFMFYCWLGKKLWPKKRILGWIPNGIKKSQLLWNHEKESLEQHMERVRKDMLEFPEKYFYREPLILVKNALDHFEKTILLPKLYRYKMLRDPKVPELQKIAMVRNKNTDYCTRYGGKYSCEFLPLCQNGWDAESFRYVRRADKHPELTDEIE